MKMNICSFLSKITTDCKTWSQKFQSLLIMIFFFFLLLRNWRTKFYFHLSYFVYINSRKNSGVIDIFSVNQLENNGPSGSEESAIYCEHITFDGICHNTDDLLDWIALREIIFWLFKILQIEPVDFKLPLIV